MMEGEDDKGWRPKLVFINRISVGMATNLSSEDTTEGLSGVAGSICAISREIASRWLATRLAKSEMRKWRR